MAEDIKVDAGVCVEQDEQEAERGREKQKESDQEPFLSVSEVDMVFVLRGECGFQF